MVSHSVSRLMTCRWVTKWLVWDSENYWIMRWSRAYRWVNLELVDGSIHKSMSCDWWVAFSTLVDEVLGVVSKLILGLRIIPVDMWTVSDEVQNLISTVSKCHNFFISNPIFVIILFFFFFLFRGIRGTKPHSYILSQFIVDIDIIRFVKTFFNIYPNIHSNSMLFILWTSKYYFKW